MSQGLSTAAADQDRSRCPSTPFLDTTGISFVAELQQYPTRKIYMLSSIDPSIELTGGPWYTDKELDTEFVSLLMDVCLKIVRDRVRP